jgi:hypothetical protein
MSYYGNCEKLLNGILKAGIYSVICEMLEQEEMQSDVLIMCGNILSDSDQSDNLAPYLLLN